MGYVCTGILLLLTAVPGEALCALHAEAARCVPRPIHQYMNFGSLPVIRFATHLKLTPRQPQSQSLLNAPFPFWLYCGAHGAEAIQFRVPLRMSHQHLTPSHITGSIRD